MKKLLAILSCLFVYGTCQATEGVIYKYSDKGTGETLSYTNEKNADHFKTVEMSSMDMLRLKGGVYTKSQFSYVNKLGNRMNCITLMEGDFLKAELTNKGWEAVVQNKDGTKGQFIFQGNASFIKTTTNGYAFCVNQS